MLTIKTIGESENWRIGGSVISNFELWFFAFTFTLLAVK
jgi:hypothetical protein